MTTVPPEVRDRIESDPFCEALGITVTELSDGYARTTLTVSDAHLNFHGTLHGGAIYSLADVAFAAASNASGRTAVGLETNISYLKAGSVGTNLVATAEKTYAGGRTSEYEVVITDDAENRIATFRGRAYRPS